MSYRALALTTAVGVIAGVHYRTANRGTNALMTGLTSLTKLNGLVLKVADLTDRSLALKSDYTNLARGKSNLRSAVLLSHKLSERACRTNELSALTGVKLDIVNDSTYGNLRNGKHVTGLDM